MDKPQPDDGFVLFVRAVPGFLVRRQSTKTEIGATADGKGSITWDTETIHAITRNEMVTAGAKYRRAITDKELVECTRVQWDEQRKAHMERKAEAKNVADQTARDAAKKADEPAAETSEKTKKGG